MSTSGVEEYQAFVQHVESKARGYYATAPVPPGQEEPILQAALGLYGPGPLLFFIFSDKAPPGVPLNQELACALALAVQIPENTLITQWMRLESQQKRLIADEAASELYDRACQEAAADRLPLAYFGFYTHESAPGAVLTMFSFRPFLPARFIFNEFRTILTGR